MRARSEVRAAWLTYRTALDLARQQQAEVVPLRQLIADETTLRYNGMLASVWDLLAEARNSTQAVANAIEAQRDFWLAETDLQLALTGFERSVGLRSDDSRVFGLRGSISQGLDSLQKAGWP